MLSQKCALPGSSTLNKVETNSWFTIKENVTPEHTMVSKKIFELSSKEYSLPTTKKKQLKVRIYHVFASGQEAERYIQEMVL